MGLDQYLNKVVVKKQTKEVEYWRKNHQLQGWFEQNCNQENCVPTTLDRDNIEIVNKLLSDLAKEALLDGVEFFYDSGVMSQEEIQKLITTFTVVRTDIIDNDAEYEYDCWY